MEKQATKKTSRDSRCHRLFYPYFVSSRSANSVNTLKTKTTVAPVRKNCENFPRIWRLPKSNLSTNQLLVRSAAVGDPELPADPIGSRDDQFEFVDIFFGLDSQSIHLDPNTFIIGSSQKPKVLRPQPQYSKLLTNRTHSSMVSPNSGTFPTHQPGYGRSPPNGYTSGDYGFQDKQNQVDLSAQYYDSKHWPEASVEEGADLSNLSSPSEATQMMEDYEQLIFSMSPFTAPQPCSIFDMADYSDQCNQLDDFDPSDIQNDHPGGDDNDDQDDDDDDDDDDGEDERSISVTSVLPIDIPQPQKTL